MSQAFINGIAIQKREWKQHDPNIGAGVDNTDRYAADLELSLALRVPYNPKRASMPFVPEKADRFRSAEPG
jgi:hypothetical protein